MTAEARPSLDLSKCQIVGNLMQRLICSISVCSDTFSKCYTIVHLGSVREDLNMAAKSWDFSQSEVCGTIGLNLVSFATQLEIDFVGFHLQKNLKFWRKTARMTRLSIEEFDTFGTSYIGEIFLTTEIFCLQPVAGACQILRQVSTGREVSKTSF